MSEPNPLTRAIARARNLVRPNIKVTPPPDDVVLERDVPVRVRDGTTLRVNVFRPKENGSYPVLMSAHPYGKDNLPRRGRGGRHRPNPQFRLMPQSKPVRFSAWTSFEAPDPAYWVPRGYVVVNADLRGWGTSDGTGDLLDMRREGDDYHDLIEWAAAQPWSNTRVGLSGVSYLAISQWSAAATRPPHLAAISPWEGFTDLYHDFALHGGVREDGFFVLWNRMARQRAGARSAASVDLRAEQRARPEYDDWWATRAVDPEPIEVPALVCGSFSDQNLHTRGSFEGFRRISSNQKWLYTHRGPKWATYYDGEALAAQTRFFDHFLAGADNGQPDQPHVRLEVRADADTVTSIRGEHDWPPRAVTWRRWHLNPANRALTDTAPEQADRAVFDTRRGSVSFTRRFTSDTEVIGPMLLRLTVGTELCTELCLFAGIRKLSDDGRPIAFENSYGFRGSLLTFGMRKARQCRDGTVTVDIELAPSATLVRAGEQLQMEIQGRWFYGRFPLTSQFPAYYEKSPPGQCIVHTGPDVTAHLEVPVIEREETE